MRKKTLFAEFRFLLLVCKKKKLLKGTGCREDAGNVFTIIFLYLCTNSALIRLWFMRFFSMKILYIFLSIESAIFFIFFYRERENGTNFLFLSSPWNFYPYTRIKKYWKKFYHIMHYALKHIPLFRFYVLWKILENYFSSEVLTSRG